ncbi:hypothetical protein AB595_08615 [Massilia sp. WF1]|uniref:hypothetical protein n=1 Tax=unclassified Massilia TaxID=2609279 RepID=UPI0006494A3A|nr:MULTISPECIES: hypothetical protein [unclassified Massilia]ALK96093.1 hypothetical protein AM586_07155 [Massilia sp. WG5]KLU37324.1 hypothetical protein AB595_08615 [Massilia sp. WF1]
MLSKTIHSFRILAGLAVTAGLVACATPAADQDQHHARHHPAQSEDMAAPASPGGSAAQGGMGSGAMTGSQGGCGMMGGNTTGSQAGCGMQHMDKDAMCAMYRSMRDAPTEQARQAMMDQNMRAMSPEMRQRHMEMLRQQCQ